MTEDQVRKLRSQLRDIEPAYLAAKAVLADPNREQAALDRITGATRAFTAAAEHGRPEVALGRILEIVQSFNEPILIVKRVDEINAKLEAIISAAAPSPATQAD